MSSVNSEENLKKYLQSLEKSCDDINEYKHTTALKDVVGKCFEDHRRNLWESYGFKVDKNKNNALFDIDWCIYDKDGKIIAYEEDKGHYVDSCFLERALTGMAKTVNNCLEKNIEVPLLILHSYTKYSKYDEKLNDFCNILKPELSEELKNKLYYTTLSNRDRLKTSLWFSNNENRKAYIENINLDLVKNDIDFIINLQK